MEAATKTGLTTVQKLERFVNQRSGIDSRNYFESWLDSEGVTAYKQDCAMITRDRQDFYSLFNLAMRRIGEGPLDTILTVELMNNSGRLTMNADQQLEYCTGQYFPTEYRPAASRLLANIIWRNYGEEKDAQGQPLYKDGHEIRAAIKKHVSRRVMKNYFN